MWVRFLISFEISLFTFPWEWGGAETNKIRIKTSGLLTFKKNPRKVASKKLKFKNNLSEKVKTQLDNISGKLSIKL